MKRALSVGALVILMVTGCVTQQETVDVPEDVDAPERIIFVAQSGTADSLYQTVIDLENNELVVLRYVGTGVRATKLTAVVRTGIILDPATVLRISATDAPFPPERRESRQENTTSGGASTGTGF